MIERVTENRHGKPDRLPISVVIPAYNAALWLRETLLSVQAQTRPASEIIVVDDGSTDSTCEIAESLGVTLIRQDRCGVSAARNRGAEAASFPWLAYLDADDLWEPEKLALQWAAIEAVPSAGLCFTGSQFFDENGLTPEGLSYIPDFKRVKLLETGVAGAYLCERDSYANVLCHVNFIVHSAPVIERAIVLAVKYAESMAYSEDLDFLLRVAAVTQSLCVVAPLTRIRKHTTNSSRVWDKMILGVVAVGEAAQRNPNLYPPGTVEEFEAMRPGRLSAAAVCMLRRGEAVGAATAARRSFNYAKTPRTFALLVLAIAAKSPIGGFALHAVRRIVKALKRR